MKHLSTFLKTISILSILILTMTSPAFASSQINVISADDAFDLALFYYCINSPADETIELDAYAITALYDNENNITHYCVDFFKENQGKGYVIIGENLTYTQCPELYMEETSKYFADSVAGKQTLYYNPFEVFSETNDNSKLLDKQNKIVERRDAKGIIFKENKKKNKDLLDIVEKYTLEVSQTRSTLSTDPYYELSSFAITPTQYLTNLGFSNITTKNSKSFDSKMSGARNIMYPSYTIPKTLTDGTTLNYAGHCTITMIANILMFWKPICCGKYPATYDEMFTTVCNIAGTLFNSDGTPYFDKSSTERGFIGSVATTIDAVNDSFGYNGRVISSGWPDWTFLKTYIDCEWPVFLGFNGNDSFEYDHHAVIAYGYNTLTATRDGEFANYFFVKVFDGYSTVPQYLSFNALQMYYLYEESDPSYLSTYMHAFCPYQ